MDNYESSHNVMELLTREDGEGEGVSTSLNGGPVNVGACWAVEDQGRLRYCPHEYAMTE